MAYSTVSNFVCIHQECHAQAVKSGGGAALSTTTAANQSTAEPAEWRIARRHNADVRCNALLPLPSVSIDKSKWAAKLGRTHQFTELATQLPQDPSISIHDLRFLFMRMAWERPLGEDTAGGSRESNLQLAVYQCSVALYALSQSKVGDLSKLSEQLQTFWLDENRPLLLVNSCWDVKGPLYQSLLSLFVLPIAEWNILRVRILFCLLILAQARQVIPPHPPGQPTSTGTTVGSASSASSATDGPTTDVAAAGGAAAASSGYVVNSLWKENVFSDFNVYKPYCLYWALMDGFYNNIFKDVAVNESENEQWNDALFKYIQNNQVTLIEQVKKFSQNFEDDLLPCSSFMEFCDCCGLLDILPMKPDDFLPNALAAVNSKSACI